MSEKQILRIVKDDLNRQIKFNFPPEKIVSLVPSITELLFDLGVGEKIIAVTDYCIYPKEAKEKLKIGGTKTFDVEKIKQLSPDIVFAEKSENAKQRTLNLAETVPVYVFEVKNFDQAINFIRTTGDLVGKRPEGRILSEKIMQKFIEYNIDFHNKTVFFPVWKNPYIAVGGNTFINSMFELVKLKNIFDHLEGYPKISEDDLRKNCPNFIFLTNEPYNFKQEDAKEFEKICPDSKIIFVDGEMFIWFGSHLLKAADYLFELQHKLLK